jgi:predicted transcriptional regulator
MVEMAISVRLDERTESLLEETARSLQTTKTEIIKRSLSDYCSHVLRQRRKRPYELIEDLVGKAGSGKGDLSTRGEEILRAAFRRKG